MIYVNNYKKETCVEKTGAINSLNVKIFSLINYILYFTQNMETRTLGKLCTLYTLIYATLAQTWTKIYAKTYLSASSGDPLTIAAMT